MIKGLTRRLNEAGKIKIGRKGAMTTSVTGAEFRPPVKLNHFVITTTEKGDDGDLIEDTNLMDEIKRQDGSMLNNDKNIIGIPIRLLYDDTELNFPTRMACYDKGILSCVGDGEKATKRLDDFKKEWPCPCAKSDPAYAGNDKCKPNGTLTCVIDAAGLFGQAHKFRTTSINSIQGIIGGIELIKLATKGKISGLPLVLTLNNKTTSIPGTGTQTKIQVVSICYRGSMADLQKKCLQIASENAQFMIEMNKLEDEARKAGALVVVPEDEERDFQEEFYPNSVIDVEPVQKNPDPDPVIGQDSKKEEPGTVEQDETNQGPETNEDDQEDTGSVITKSDPAKLALLNRLKAEMNAVAAWKLVPRLDKAYLIQYLKDMHPHPQYIPDLKENKPVFVGFVTSFIGSDAWKEKMGAGANSKAFDHVQAEIESGQIGPEEHPFIIELKAMQTQPEILAAMRGKFTGPINGTLPPSELIKLAERLVKEQGDGETKENKETPDLKPQENGPNNEPEPDLVSEEFPAVDPTEAYKWDDGGPVEQTQLAQIKKLKEDLKINDPNEWAALVAKYTDATGTPLGTCVKMTKKQAEHFIRNLEEAPF